MDVFSFSGQFTKQWLDWIFQAAKEFETELKAAPEDPNGAPADEPKPVIEEEKQGDKVTSSKESV